MKLLSILSRKQTDARAYFSTALMVLFALQLTIPPCVIEAQAAPPGAQNFEIPTGELNRETNFEIPMGELNIKTNVAPVKRAVRTPEKRKESAARARRSRDAAKSSRTTSKKVTSVVASQQTPLTTSEAIQPFRVFNVPYSFVVTGKSTVIKAVIYREADDLQSVNCKIRTASTGAHSVVKMAKVDGFRFTYAATIPEAAVDASALRYTIVAIDSSLMESISPEFASPTKISPVVPDWQF